ncbi:MAG: patatin family protein [Longicatena sp.]
MGKLGLVLEGGGMRGIYTAGVLDFFLDYNIYTDGVIGVSAGACHACSYASKQRGRAFRTNTDYIKDKRYMSMRSLITTGDLFGAKFVYDDIPNKLDIYDYETFNKGEIKLYAVCSNIETGKAEYIQCINMVHDVIYVRASASLPLLSKVVEVDGKKLLDGGACDSIPIKRFQEMGYDKNIVVLTQCKEYRKGKNNLLPIIRKVYRKYPKFIAKLEKRHVEYNRTLNELSLMEKEGSVFIIRPSAPVEISRLEKNVDKLKALYDQGYQDAQEQYAALKEFMEN